MSKRRSNGEGSIKKLRSGNWRGQIMAGYNAEGKRIIKSFSAPTKAEVQAKIRQFLEECREDHPTIATIAFSDWADTWYAGHRTEVEESTYWNYYYTLKMLKEYFKDTPITDIKQMDINQFIDELIDRGLSKSTISKCKAMLVQIFTSAENNDLIKKNPARLAKKLKTDKNRVHEKEAFSPAEVEIMRTQLPDTLIGNSINALVGTGMRVQELLALRKDNISPDGAFVTVDKAVKMAYRKPQLGTTKSKKGRRVIPVLPGYECFTRYLREHSGEKFIWTSNRENGLYTIEEFRNRYKTAMRHLQNVSYKSPHSCRHTYITNLQANKVPIDYISALVGHSDTTTTLGYSHISLETLTKVVSSLNKTGES